MEKEQYTKIAENVLRIRFSQMIINEKIKKGEFKIPIHLALGHEAIAVAVDLAMGEEDKLVLSHRNVHYNLARTKLLKPELDEYLLKKEGLGGGRLGSMNLANEEKNIVYTSSILGNNLSVASGLSLGQKVKKAKGIIIVITGDGAIEEGSFYESLLFLQSQKLPAIIIIENNNWSLATKIEERRCEIGIDKISESLSVRYEKLAKNDVFDYIERLKLYRKFSLENKTPVVIEVVLTTLGGYYLKTEGKETLRFVNYHAGAAPEVNLKEWPLIEESSKDPIFVLGNKLGKETLMRLSADIFKKLKEEILE